MGGFNNRFQCACCANNDGDGEKEMTSAPSLAIKTSNSSQFSWRSTKTKDLLDDKHVQRYFPMLLVRLETLLVARRLQSCGKLQANSRLMEEEPDIAVHFVSHQWLSFKHPDPDGIQLRKLQSVWRTFLANQGETLFAHDDWSAFLEGASSGSARAVEQIESIHSSGKTTEEAITDDILEGSVWIDFCCVPQVVDVVDVKDMDQTTEQQSKAIASIPAYVQRADYFWVVAPRAVHADTGVVCNFNTWRRRGWCRLEEWANNLVERRKFPLVLTDKPKLDTVGMVDYYVGCVGHEDRSVCSGDFTCCSLGHVVTTEEGHMITIPCDKEKVSNVIRELYRGKKAAWAAADQKLMHNFSILLKRAVYAGSDFYEKDYDAHESVGEFLSRIKYKDVDDTDGLGSGPWLPACMTAHPDLLALLEKAKPGMMTSRNKIGFMPLMGFCLHYEDVLEELMTLVPHMGDASHINLATELGYTALSYAASGWPDRVKLLLERKADVNHQDSCGRTALHAAAMKNVPACMDILIAHKADVDLQDKYGNTALHYAADVVTILGNNDDSSKTDVVKSLVAARARVQVQNKEGKTPAVVAAESCCDAALTLLS
mmetsp:Transcript_75234/g.178767  ORF Transcript_75234/g.178767 Transcript_75234/m.178767 type:complete len:599 (+) Transcript_75234:134-1930(+)